MANIPTKKQKGQWQIALDVAEKVMGWPVYDGPAHQEGSRPYPHCWRMFRGEPQFMVYDGEENRYFVPSADFNDAIDAAEKVMRDSGNTCTIQIYGTYPGSGDTPVFACEINAMFGSERFQGEGDTPELAICNCVLAAGYGTSRPNTVSTSSVTTPRRA